ncbi:hypothetical protein Taro_020555 [Colocasia esculenta]|uniref:Membrane insertase YidC/Oxa/ALB C-terminal domain-containing protein n=1 Tax=Colocasia esculenta TaxID=4460 RepID=A0A843UWN8_COLES|nr:hypothetical protein [Colocasia esculenta]
MAARLVASSPSFLAPPLSPLPHRHGRHPSQPLCRPRRAGTRVRMSLHGIPPPLDSVDIQGIIARAEGILYTLADAAVAADPAAAAAAAGGEPDAAAAVQKNGGWFGFISEAMEVVLKVLKDGLDAVHVPYAYGFAIILLTVIVKVATFPLTKKQVESTLAMQNLQPKIKAIQERYAGNQGIMQLNKYFMGNYAVVASAPTVDIKLGGHCLGFHMDSGPTDFARPSRPHWLGEVVLSMFLFSEFQIRNEYNLRHHVCTNRLGLIPWQGLLTEGFFWIPSLGGPTTIAARQSGAGISWLLPFVCHPLTFSLIQKKRKCLTAVIHSVSNLPLMTYFIQDGHPPLGWSDTAAYLVLPVLLVISQYVSMEIMKPPQTDDPAQKNSLLVFKFLPLMIGYFSLSVPSGLSIYWFINNVLSTGQQVWLRKLGGAKPAVNKDGSGIISAGQAKRSGSEPARTGERFRQLKEEEGRRVVKSLPDDESQTTDAASDPEDLSDDESKEDAREGAYASSGSKQIPEYTGPRRSKRSKRKRTVK